MALVPMLTVKAKGVPSIRIDAEAPLADLHALLSPGSSDLHEFAVNGTLYGEPDADDQLVGRRVTDDRGVTVATIAGKKVEYRCGGLTLALQVR